MELGDDAFRGSFGEIMVVCVVGAKRASGGGGGGGGVVVVAPEAAREGVSCEVAELDGRLGTFSLSFHFLSAFLSPDFPFSVLLGVVEGAKTSAIVDAASRKDPGVVKCARAGSSTVHYQGWNNSQGKPI